MTNIKVWLVGSFKILLETYPKLEKIEELKELYNNLAINNNDNCTLCRLEVLPSKVLEIKTIKDILREKNICYTQTEINKYMYFIFELC